MKIAVVTFSDMPKHPGLARLQNSAIRHSWDFQPIFGTWGGYGTKINETARIARVLQAKGYTHILFQDAHDTYFVRPAKEFEAAVLDPGFMFVSSEKACWPDPNRADDYHYNDTPPSPWCYVNSGQYLAPIALFLRIVEENPISNIDDDQRWLTNVYLSKRYPIILDVNCNLFQSIAFEAPGDFRINDKGLINTTTRCRAFAVHGNGRTPMEWVTGKI